MIGTYIPARATGRPYRFGVEIAVGQPIVLVVEDSWMYATVFEEELATRGMRAITAADPVAALRLAVRRRPSAAVLDVNLGDGDRDGIALIPEIRHVSPATRFVVMSGEVREHLVRRAIAAGAHGFLAKRDLTDAQRCSDAVGRALAGGVTFDSEVHPFLVRIAQSIPDPATRAGLRALDVLILLLVEEGLQDVEIAARLGRSVQTIRNRNHEIYRALGAANRTAAVTQARRLGILDG